MRLFKEIFESRMRVIVLGGNQSLRMGMRVLTCQMLRNMQTFLVSDIPLVVAGEEFMVREKPIREKFIIWWKYIYPWDFNLYSRFFVLFNFFIFYNNITFHGQKYSDKGTFC